MQSHSLYIYQESALKYLMLKTNENIFKLISLLIWITEMYIRRLMIRFSAFYMSHVSKNQWILFLLSLLYVAMYYKFYNSFIILLFFVVILFFRINDWLIDWHILRNKFHLLLATYTSIENHDDVTLFPTPSLLKLMVFYNFLDSVQVHARVVKANVLLQAWMEKRAIALAHARTRHIKHTRVVRRTTKTLCASHLLIFIYFLFLITLFTIELIK